MTSHLFVYGTLLTGAESRLGAHERVRLGAEARFVTAGMANGQLFDLGNSPGLLVDASEFVTGEILELASPGTTLPWLDDYEEINHLDPANGLYRRVVHSVTGSSGAAFECWIYELTHLPAGARPIISGDWLAYSAQTK